MQAQSTISLDESMGMAQSASRLNQRVRAARPLKIQRPSEPCQLEFQRWCESNLECHVWCNRGQHSQGKIGVVLQGHGIFIDDMAENSSARTCLSRKALCRSNCLKSTPICVVRCPCRGKTYDTAMVQPCHPPSVKICRSSRRAFATYENWQEIGFNQIIDTVDLHMDGYAIWTSALLYLPSLLRALRRENYTS